MRRAWWEVIKKEGYKQIVKRGEKICGTTDVLYRSSTTQTNTEQKSVRKCVTVKMLKWLEGCREWLCSSSSRSLSEDVLARTSGRISNPTGQWEKQPQPTSHREAVTIHFTIKICWGGVGIGSVGGPNAWAHIRLRVGRGRESIELRGLAQILDDFTFSEG